MKKDKKEQKVETPLNEITRKDAIKKTGKYAAITAATMFLILSPKDSPAQSPAPTSLPTPGWG